MVQILMIYIQKPVNRFLILNNQKKIIVYYYVNLEVLNNNSQQFANTSHQVKNKYWWKNVKVIEFLFISKKEEFYF